MKSEFSYQLEIFLFSACDAYLGGPIFIKMHNEILILYPLK